jgi:glutathione S-transferase
MKLYYASGACSLSPHIVAREAGIPLELIKVDLSTGTYAGGDFKKINPKGYVPVLEMDGGARLTEGVAITQYLADQKPEAKLAPPAGTMERYRLLEWQVFISTELHKGSSPLFGKQTEEDKAATVKKLTGRYEYVNSQLEGKKYLLGEQFTIADAYLFTTLTWAEKMKIDLSSLTHLKGFYDRVKERPAVKEALAKEA